MKKSKSLTLLLMGGLALSSTACSTEEQKEAFNAFGTVKECASSGLFSEKECQDFAANALVQSPTFSTKDECEAKFGIGACEGASALPGTAPLTVAGLPGQTQEPTAASQAAPLSNSTVQPHTQSSWMPMMMGFMAGRFLGGSGMMQGAQPLYRQPNDAANQGKGTAGAGSASSYRTASGTTITTDKAGRVTTPPSTLRQSFSHTAKPVVARSGAASSGGFSSGARSGGAVS